MASALTGGLFGALQAAQQRIGDEINEFKQEAAHTEVWKQEAAQTEERRKSVQVDLASPPPQKQPADGYVASTYGFVAVTPSPSASKFSIDEGPTERAALEPTPATSVAGQGAQGAAALARRVKELEESLREQKGRAVRDGLAQGKQHSKQLGEMRAQFKRELEAAAAAAAEGGRGEAGPHDNGASSSGGASSAVSTEVGGAGGSVDRWLQRLDSMAAVAEAEAEAETAAETAAAAAETAAGEAAAAGETVPPPLTPPRPTMCGKALLVQLRRLRKDVSGALAVARAEGGGGGGGGGGGEGAASSGAAGAVAAVEAVAAAPPAAAAPAAGSAALSSAAAAQRQQQQQQLEQHQLEQQQRQISALEEQVESLATALAKEELNSRQKAEAARRHAEGLEERAEHAEAEVLDRMTLVADAMGAEEVAKSGAASLEEELREVRSKAGSRIKQLCAKDKKLEEEVAALRKEVNESNLLAEMNASKESSLQTALGLMRDETEGAGKTVKELEARHAQERAYLRALILRYLEMESQHEARPRAPTALTPPPRPLCPEHAPPPPLAQALFPAIATYFKFTEEEVARLALKQEEHAYETSVLGRTLNVGSLLFGVARDHSQGR